MKPETRYRYAKQIAELKRENDNLRLYRDVAYGIFTMLTDNLMQGQDTKSAWVVQQFRRVFK